MSLFLVSNGKIVNGLIILFLILAVTFNTADAFFKMLSDESDGLFVPTQNITLTVPPDGIFNFTDISIPTGVKVTFHNNGGNTPVYMLATGYINISGTINVSGGTDGGNLVAGPGGFNGGYGGGEVTAGQSGEGVGGGQGGPPRNAGGGGGFATAGLNGKTDGCVSDPGQGGETVPIEDDCTFIGGSGGGGGGGGSYGVSGCSGGGGGGAVYLSTPGDIIINGSILSNGGGGVWCYTSALCGIRGGPGGGGSGGYIRLEAGRIFLGEEGTISSGPGPGGVRSSDGSLTHFGGDGGDGYIMLKAKEYELYGDIIGFNLAPFCPDDFDGQNDVDGVDLGMIAKEYGSVDCQECISDINCDGSVDEEDLRLFTVAYGGIGCP